MRKLRTPPVFYVGLLIPYRDPSQVDREALAPRKLALPQAATSESGGQVAPPSVSDSFQTSTSELAPRQACAGSDPKSREDCPPREPKPHGLQPTYRPPPALLEQQGNLWFHVENILQRRRRHGKTSIW